MSSHGTPCWYELCTRGADQARDFYVTLLGWSFQDAGMEGFAYGLALKDGAMIAGIMEPDSPMPEFWMVYIAVENCDHTVAKAKGLGANVHRAPEDIPGTGRFAILADPQGAAFGVMQLLDDDAQAFDQSKPGHGNWHELHSTDPEAGFQFYAALFGWSATGAMDMGAEGTYQLFAHDGRDIGGMMGMLGMQGAPPHWLPYFAVEGIDTATGAITSLGGKVLHGPVEVPGGAWITMATDTRGAAFAVVGPR